MASIDEALHTAVRHHQSGRLAEAEQIYRQILSAQPGNPDALHLLGVIALQGNQPQLAVDRISQAIRIQGTQAAYYYHLGQAYLVLGRLADARASFEQALRLNPQLAATHYQLGFVEQHSGQLAAATEHYRRALRLQPELLEAQVNLGDVLRAQGKLDEAVTAYRAAVLLRPDCVEALHNLGAALVDLERFPEAVEYLQSLVTLRPELAEAHYSLGRAHKGLGRRDEARFCFQKALDVRPDFAIAYYTLANMLYEQDDLETAAEAYRAALRLEPNDAEAQANYGKVLHKLGHTQEAMDHYDRAIELQPDLAVAHFSRALILLRNADFEGGWREYAWRVQLSKFPLEVREESLWDGSELRGATLLVHAEQGMGDTLQFIRFIPLVKSLAPSVIVRVQTPLVPLLRNSGFDPFGDQDELPHFHWQVPLLSLPGILGTDLSNIPAPVPYLAADPGLVQHWQKRLAATDEFKVGVAWQGNPKNVGDRRRSIPLISFLPLAEVGGVTFVSLQKESGTDQIAQAADRLRLVTLDGLDEGGGAFMDTAAVMKNLDLVITCDSAVAHLAGGLGVKVWVALSASADWRWLLNRDDSPWYPTMRLFRQSKLGDWAAMFARMAAELARVAEETSRKNNSR